MRSLMRAVASIVFASAVFGQVPGTGSMEVGGFVGATYGTGSYGEMVCGNISNAVNKYLLPYVEFSYFPYIERQVTGTIGGTSTKFQGDYSLSGTDFHGGVHIRVPIRESRIVPYGVFGVGRLGYSSSTISLTVPGFSAPIQVTSPGGGKAAVNFGGGLRFYVHPRFGLRVEAKGYKPFGEPSEGGADLGYSKIFLKVEGGFFLQFR